MEKDYGFRKVQSTGRGSFIISLPRDWVAGVGIEKGNEIAFKEQDDSSLLLVPRELMEGKKASKSELKEFWINVDPKDDPQSVCRKILSLYVVSADLIRINFRDSEKSQIHKAAINALVKKKLLGSEIIEETNKQITIQILIDHPDFPLEKAIRRMAILALSANKDVLRALKIEEDDLAHEIIDTCDDVKRLNLYVIRQLKSSLERNEYEDLGFKTPKEFLGYRIVTSDIRSIADDAVNIVSNISALRRMIKEQTLFLRDTIDEEVYSQISKFNSSSHEMLEESLKAMFKRDYVHADKIVTRLESMTELENDLLAVMSSKKLDPNVSSIFRLVLDGSRRILEYSRDISEVTLNRTIEEIASPVL